MFALRHVRNLAAILLLPVFLICSDDARGQGGKQPSLTQKAQSPATPPRDAGLSPDAAALQLQVRPDLLPHGLYELETALHFNVLDAVYLDRAGGRISLIGHRDEAYGDVRIPYLQHLATLLEVQDPRTAPAFSLDTTPESRRAVANFVAGTTVRQADVHALIDRSFDQSDRVTPIGRAMLPELDISAIAGFKAPGWLGADVDAAPSGAVRIVKIISDSPAERAGLKTGDVIVKVGDQLPVAPNEFRRLVRFAGADREISLNLTRSGAFRTVPARLARDADADTTKDVTRYDIEAALYRSEGQDERGKAVYGIGVLRTFLSTPAEIPAMQALAFALGLQEELVKLLPEFASGRAASEAVEAELGRRICRRAGEVFAVGDHSLETGYESELNGGKPAGGALVATLHRLENSQTTTTRKLIERAYRGEGIQVPPELVAGMMPVRPQSRPDFRGFSANSLLARAMYDGDYIIKRLPHRSEFRHRIEGYKTIFEFKRNRPQLDNAMGLYRAWISVAKLEAAQRPDGDTLEFRDVKMRISFSKSAADGVTDARDQPAGLSQYADLLSGQYDAFAREYPTLHELREAAKLAAVATWIHGKDPSMRLPQSGRVEWQGPATLPGLIYLHMPPRSATSTDVGVLAHGGVNLVPFRWDAPQPIGNDPSVVDARNQPRVNSPPPASHPLDAIAAPPNGQPINPSSWVARDTRNGKRAETVTFTPVDENGVTIPNYDGSISRYNRVEFDAARRRVDDFVAANDDPARKAAGLTELAWFYHAQGNDSAAIDALKKAVELKPNLPIYKLLFCATLDESGKRRAAISCLKEYIAREPSNWAAKKLLGELEADPDGRRPSPTRVSPPPSPDGTGGNWGSLNQLEHLAQNDVQNRGTEQETSGRCLDARSRHLTAECGSEGDNRIPQFPRMPPSPPDAIPMPSGRLASNIAVQKAFEAQDEAYREYTTARNQLRDAQEAHARGTVGDDELKKAEALEAEKHKDVDEARKKAGDTLFEFRGSADDDAESPSQTPPAQGQQSPEPGK
jgi:tetratricopeptide (TPR) repeat protein